MIQKSVYIASDGGRVCRPLLVLGHGGTLQLTQVYISISLYALYWCSVSCFMWSVALESQPWFSSIIPCVVH